MSAELKPASNLGAARPHFESEATRSFTRWTIAAYACIGAALCSVLIIAVWGVLHDLSDARLMRLNTELNRLRSHATRTVGMLQDTLGKNGNDASLESLRDDAWLRNHWSRTVPNDPSRLYAAVIDPQGVIVMHSTPEAEGKFLDIAWYDRVVSELGRDVLETNASELTGGQRSYDISVPIFFRDRQIGTYHSGFNRDWFETVAAEAQVRAKTRWAVVLAFMAIVVCAALLSLYHITRRATLLGQSMRLSRARRFAEMGQLIGGIAHEIRNPLNAMRLNLHMLERFQNEAPPPPPPPAPRNTGGPSDGQAGNSTDNGVARRMGIDPDIDSIADEMEADDLDAFGIIQETNREIDRVEELMKILLGYARPERPKNDFVDVGSEVHALIRFLRPTMDSAGLVVRAYVPSSPVSVFIDRNRLRQIMLNLLNNAREATPQGGRVEVHIAAVDGEVKITVIDTGPGVAEADRDRIFEPFFSSKELGTGLGLPLVRRFVEEAGGHIEYAAVPGAGATFEIKIPEAIAMPADSDSEPMPTATRNGAASR